MENGLEIMENTFMEPVKLINFQICLTEKFLLNNGINMT